MVKIVIPKDKHKIEAQIKSLRGLLKADDVKSRAIHEQTLEDLGRMLKA